MKPTLKSLAAELSIDPSLISRVLRGVATARISDEKRAQILETAARLGYRPDRAARSLKFRSSRIVAMLTPDITNPFHSLLFRGAERAAQAAGYSVLLCHVSDASNDGLATIARLADGLADGVLVACGLAGDTRLATLRDGGLPYVLINRPTGDAADIWYGPDDFRSGELGAELLHAHGHRRIIAMFGDMRLGNMRRRRDGFVQRAAQLGLQAPALQVCADVSDREAIERILRTMAALPKPQRPTGVFVPHSTLAQVVLEECLPLRIAVPHELSVVGYGGDSGSRISGIQVPAERMGQEAMLRLLALLGGEGPDPGGLDRIRQYAPEVHGGYTVAAAP